MLKALRPIAVIGFILLGGWQHTISRQSADSSGNESYKIDDNFINLTAEEVREKIPPGWQTQFMPRHPAHNYVAKMKGHYTKADWQAVIDSTWGEGFTADIDSFIYQYFWDIVDDSFACFQEIVPDPWDSIYSSNMPEIATGVSKGRLSAFLTQSALLLRETHTWVWDEDVIYTNPAPGVPVLNISMINVWTIGQLNNFGAAATSTADSTIFVYRAVEGHPLGIVPGDIILGYDGILWEELYPQLIEVPLPIYGMWGSSPSSFTHSCLSSAGMNWHLFDTIDVVKYETGDTLHLSTEPLTGLTEAVFGTEQMDIPGVPFPDWQADQWVSHGFIEGTNIGYIYCWGWHLEEIMGQFSNAISVMMNDPAITGLIVDYRSNGGGWAYAQDGYSQLFDTTIDVYSWDKRCNSEDHLLMCPDDWPDDTLFNINGYPGSFFDKPIAMLTGPGCISAGDYNAMVLAYHPMVKAFGRPTMAAFNAPRSGFSIISNIMCRYAHGNAYLDIDPHNYLTHKEFPDPENFPWLDYQEVWLTPEGVYQDHDDVVDSAVAWILSRDLDQDGVVNENDNCPEMANADQSDIDADGVGDVCDNCPDDYNPLQEDTDENGVGDICQYLCGDATDDGTVNILDITFLIAYLYQEGPAPVSEWAADPNGDGTINILDISYLIAYLYQEGPEPACL